MKWCLANNIKLSLDNPILMGILNITPDSFSDGRQDLSIADSYNHSLKILSEGANIIDIGGESTKPGAIKVDCRVEQQRILPILQLLHKNTNAIISVDTYNSSTASLALENGCNIINDVYGLQYDENMANVVAQYQAGIIIMHTNRGRDSLPDIIEDQKYFFDKSLNIAHKAGIKDSAIALDPGFGFGKNYEHNIQLFKRINELSIFNYPLVAATSRKGFLGEIANLDNPAQRDIATSVTSVLLRSSGFSIFRVHSVKANKEALDVYEALKY